MDRTLSPGPSGSSLQGKRVLITGGLGFIGSNLARCLLELGAKVTIFDNLDPHSGGNPYNVHDIRADLEFKYHDILDYDRVVRHVVEKDYIFNCAASTSHPLSMREPWLDLDVNCRGVINLLEAIRRFNQEGRFIQVGTSSQFGRHLYQPADEKHPEFPLDIYSANKSVSEKYVLIYHYSYNLQASVVRLSNTYGPRASIHSAEFTFNNYFIGLALQNRDITIFGDGQQKRNLIFVGDAVDALIDVALTPATVGEVFLAVSDEHHSLIDISREIIEHIGSGRLRFIPWPKALAAIEIGDVILSNAKIKKVTGWQPNTSFENGLAITRHYYMGCLERYIK